MTSRMLDFSKIYKYLFAMAVGVCLILYGLLSIAFDLNRMHAISDAQVIERAKALGYVELREAYSKSVEATGKNKKTPASPTGTKQPSQGSGTVKSGQ